MKPLFPVILSVPDKARSLSGRERVLFLSRHARMALARSAELSGIRLGELEKDEKGVPLPSAGNYWSISHKPLYVAGVVSDRPVGIDIEQIHEINPALYRKVAGEDEWMLGDGRSIDLFFRFWTAKEAVIKVRGTGIRDMRKCRVIEVRDKNTLRIECSGVIRDIEQVYFDGHIASLICPDHSVRWELP